MITALHDRLAQAFSPWVFRAAYRKVERLYQMGEWNDSAEWLDWLHRPWENLSALANDLLHDTYQPGPFPLVPYPKRDRTRHYAVAAVREQVAFMVFMVLLGPFLEARMPNVSFGHRLYRRRYLRDPRDRQQNDRPKRSQWVSAPFALQDRVTYDSFSSGYGLYRRLAQWIATRGVYGDNVAKAVQEEASTEDPTRLPYAEILRGNVWTESRRLAFARLDLTLAYPSVDRDSLGSLLCNLVGDADCYRSWQNWGRVSYSELCQQGADAAAVRREFEAGRRISGEHPWHLLRNDETLRVHLAKQLGKMLQQVQYAPWHEPPQWNSDDMAGGQAFAFSHVRDAEGGQGHPSTATFPFFDTHGLWPRDCHLSGELLKSRRYGIPTGLAISGWLFNVAMTPLDQKMCELYDAAEPSRKVAYLRFVDDMILMSPSTDALREALDVIKQTLRDLNPQFRLNLDKASPPSVRHYLLSSKWRFSDIDMVARHNVSQFITTAVREMSATADAAIDEIAGAPAFERLERLIDLATRTDEDLEVAADARSSFAVNRIASSPWLSTDINIDGRVCSPDWCVERIQQTAEEVLRRYPHRIRLWRPILVIALRSEIWEKGKGGDWLQHILTMIRWEGDLEKGALEENTGPDISGHSLTALLEYCEHLGYIDPQTREQTAAALQEVKDLLLSIPDDAVKRREQHRRVRTSFLRACFWREWTWLVRLLQNAVTNGNVSRSPWLQEVAGKGFRSALAWLSDFGRWAKMLYASPSDPHYWPIEPFLWWWEAEAVRLAMLAVTPVDSQLLATLLSPYPNALRGVQPDIDQILCEPWRGSQPHGALCRVLGYDGFRFHEDDRNLTATTLERRTLSLLWLQSCQPPGISVNESSCTHDEATQQQFFAMLAPTSGLYPEKRDALGWAALARAGRWDNWSDLPVRIGQTLSLPTLASHERLPHVWRNMLRLDTYAMIRRLLMAHGEVVLWRRFAPWFSRWGGMKVKGRRCRHSLLNAMRSIARTNGEMSSDHVPLASVPEYPLPAGIAWRTILAIREKTGEDQGNADHLMASQTRLLAPETVVLKKNACERLAEGRGYVLAPAWGRDTHPTDLAAHAFAAFCELKDPVNRVRGLLPNDTAPHPLFLLPDLLTTESGFSLASWHWGLACLYLWLLSGGEHVLDDLYHTAPWQLPLQERDDLRARFLVPAKVWTQVQSWFDGELGCHDPTHEHDDEMGFWRIADIKFEDDFAWDVTSWNSKSTLGEGGQNVGRQVTGSATTDRCGDELRVRLVQIRNTPQWSSIFQDVKAHRWHAREASRTALSEVAGHLGEIKQRARAMRGAVEHTADHRRLTSHDLSNDHLVILPEFAFPASLLRQLRQFVRQTGVAILVGLQPYELPRAVPTTRGVWQEGVRLLVNEAALLLPERLETPYLRTTRVHTFRIRKSYPSALELGMAEYLTNEGSAKASATDGSDINPRPVRWTWAPGFLWHRWTYPNWGCFTVGLCSDILDTEVWNQLRGHVQHLFLVAWNEDVDLFDQMTWTRGFELYSNVVLVNHGSKGGSAAWSPQSGHGKELLRIRGGRQSLSATVSLPIKQLIRAQREQLEIAVNRSVETWAAHSQDKDGTRKREGVDQREDPVRFKTPAPRYRYGS